MCNLLYILIMIKTKLHSFQTSFPKQDILHVYDQFLQNILLQTPNKTDPLYAQFPHQRSSVGQIISHSESLEETSVSIRNRFPQNDPVSHTQKYLDLLTIIFHSVLDIFVLVDDLDSSQFLIRFHFLQNFFES